VKGLKAWLSRKKAVSNGAPRPSRVSLWESTAVILSRGREKMERDRASLLAGLDGTARELLEGCLDGSDQIDEALRDHLRCWILQSNPGESDFAEGKLWEWLKKPEFAERAYRSCVSRIPMHSRARNELGLLLMAREQYDEAIACLGSAIQGDPGNAVYHNNLGIALRNVGEFEDAFDRFQKAWQLDSTHRDIRGNLFNAAMELDSLDVARSVVDTSSSPKSPSSGSAASIPRISGLPDSDLAWSVFAKAKLALKSDDQEEAELFFEQLLAIDAPAGLTGLGNLAQSRGDFVAAAGGFRKLLAYTPGNSTALYNLALAVASQGNSDTALTLLDRALCISPNTPLFLFKRATLCLGLGRWAEGWRDHEARLRIGAQLSHYGEFDAEAIWRGESVVGKTLAIVGEQGAGDQIQFVRFAAKIADLGAEVAVYCDQPLKRLLASVPGVAKVYSKGEASIPYDFWVPMLSLPRVLGINGESFHASLPYVRPDPLDQQRWRERLREEPALKVGVVWAGNPAYGGESGLDRRRSLALGLLAPLWEAPGVSFYSLQKGPPRQQIRDFQFRHRLLDYADEWLDYADTAAFISALDLVVTVDTSVAHLAGALGKPVWILSRFDACWRWLGDREDSPWYPSARLYRMGPAETWTSVICRVANELSKLAATNDRLACNAKTIRPSK